MARNVAEKEYKPDDTAEWESVFKLSPENAKALRTASWLIGDQEVPSLRLYLSKELGDDYTPYLPNVMQFLDCPKDEAVRFFSILSLKRLNIF